MEHDRATGDAFRTQNTLLYPKVRLASKRTALTLREFDGLSYEEIAEVMACPVGTVRSRIFRARESVDARVQDQLQGQSGAGYQ